MTALKEYLRLESTGLWRPSVEGQRRDVYVFVGQATLVIADKSEAPLSHWSLAAIERVNPGGRPAIFAPGPDADETLEVADPDMINAIERVQRAVRRADPKPGRLRLLTASLFGFAVLAIGALWLPRAVADHAARVVPEVQRAAVGEALFAEMQRLTGPPCGRPGDAAVLTRLATRSLGPGAPPVRVLRDGVADSLQLPGGMILLSHRLVEDFETASPAAGFLVAARERAERAPPFEVLLEEAGVVAVLRLLTTGQMPQQALRTHAQTLARSAPAPLRDTALVEGFARARLPTTPYARAIDITGETTSDLIAADPFADGAAPIVLDDNSWVILQGICGN
ncbi:hypothetical protein [Tropicimonas sp. S265A]|uniref:hypothetical protein n=1 Tax=Tropicimonas sp. S265A TaxID=3415134 RepID=UPI003C7C50AD